MSISEIRKKELITALREQVRRASESFVLRLATPRLRKSYGNAPGSGVRGTTQRMLTAENGRLHV